MKIAVYAICGPGETAAAVDRMVRSADEADIVIVAMTCDSAEAAQAAYDAGAVVRRIDIKPFRFDDARNAALAMVPPDIDVCIALDIDETLEPNSLAILEKCWRGGDNCAWIRFEFNGVTFEQNNRVHSRHGWRWKHPCHEALVPSMSQAQAASIPGVKIVHRPDVAKPRPNYLELLAWGQFEYPTSTRMLFYYGRELLFQGHPKDALERFTRYLELEPQSPFPAERAQALAYVEECRAAVAQDGETSPGR